MWRTARPSAISTKIRRPTIYYTLDGTVPTPNRTRYTAPVRLDSTDHAECRCCCAGKEYQCSVSTKYLQLIQDRRRIVSFSLFTKVPGGGNNALIDGTRGTTSYANPAWQAFEGEDCSVVLDLGKDRPVHSVIMGCASEMGSWIFYPTSISVAVSQDGKTFGKEVTKNLGIPTAMEDSGVQDIPVEVGGAVGRYVRVTAKRLGTCPPWHPGKGGKAWIFIDEIFVE